jgi:hypothetical protein
MKFLAVFLAFVALAAAGPVKIEDNNIGDIVTVKVSGTIDISKKVDQTIVNVIVAILNQELAAISVDDEGRPRAPNFPRNLEVTPEMIEKVKSYLTKAERN